MAAERRAHADWKGNLVEGRGTVSIGSGAFDALPVTWAARTETPEGKTSPEELIAAAHATCFAMSFASNLTKAGHTPEKLTVNALCTADRVDGRFTILSMDLDVVGHVQGIDKADFDRIAQETKEGCPVSRALKNNIEIRLKARLGDS